MYAVPEDGTASNDAIQPGRLHRHRRLRVLSLCRTAAPPPALPPHSCTEAQGYTLQLVCPSAVPSRPSNGEGNTLQRPSGRLTETRLLHRPGQPRVEMTRRSTRRRVDADGRSHPVEHDSALTQNKVQTPATAWVSPENVLSEGSQPP